MKIAKFNHFFLLLLVSFGYASRMYGMDAGPSAPSAMESDSSTGMDVDPSSAAMAAIPSPIVPELAKDPSSFLSVLPRDITQYMKPLTDDTNKIVQVINNSQGLDDFLSNPNLEGNLDFDPKIIGDLLKKKFGNNLYKKGFPKSKVSGYRNPLNFAIENGKIGLTKALLAAEALEPSHVSGSFGGFSYDPFDNLVKSSIFEKGIKPEIWTALLKAFKDSGRNISDVSAKFDGELLPSIIRQQKQDFGKILDLLAQGGLDVTSQAASSLVAAVDHGNLDAVKIFLKMVGNPNVVDGNGFTPLIAAITTSFENQNEIASYLLSQGADVNKKDAKYKVTPLWWAVAAGYDGSSENIYLLKILLQAGADPTIINDHPIDMVLGIRRLQIPAGLTPSQLALAMVRGNRSERAGLINAYQAQKK